MLRVSSLINTTLNYILNFQTSTFGIESRLDIVTGHPLLVMLNLTIEMLSQLEQQVDIELNRNQNSKDVPAPNLNAMDFPALSVADNENRLPDYSRYDLQQELSLYSLSGKGSTLTFKSGSSVPDICSLDFASAVKKATSQNSSIWKFDKNGSIDERVRSSRSSNMLTNPYNGSQNRGSDSKG